VNAVLADWVQNASPVTVKAADFIGTGKLPPTSHGGLLDDQDWSKGNLSPALIPDV